MSLRKSFKRIAGIAIVAVMVMMGVFTLPSDAATKTKTEMITGGNKVSFSRPVAVSADGRELQLSGKTLVYNQKITARANGITLEWNNLLAEGATGFDGYIITRREGEANGTNNGYKEIARTNASTFTYTDKTATKKNTQYAYLIFAYKKYDSNSDRIGPCSLSAVGVAYGSERSNAHTANINLSGVKQNIDAGSSGYGTGKTITLLRGDKIRLDIVYAGGSLSSWTRWRSSNSAVASIALTSGGAYVTANGTGTTLISARTPDGRDMRVTIKVVNSNEVNAGYAELNKYRKANGRAELKRDPVLEQVAQVRAREISSRFAHTRPNGSSYATAFPSNITAVGENIAWGGSSAYTAAKVVSVWSGDAPHRNNMLTTGANAVGIAKFEVNGKVYWVQNFGYVR